MTEIGKSYNVSHSAISRLKGEVERLPASNYWLDAQVTTLREQRDRALAQAAPSC